MNVGVIAFAFGTPCSILSNRRIATIADIKARMVKASIYTQMDVPLKTSVPVEYIQEEPDIPPPTLRIARGAVTWAEKNGIREIWIVAAQPHMWQAVRDVRMAAREQRVSMRVYTCSSEVEHYPEDSWFCPDSTQKRVTSRQEWQKRELILKLMPFWLYKRIAS